MIPLNTFTTEPIISDFQAPYNLPYQPLYQVVLGGVAIGNPSEGRQVKLWAVSYNGTLIEVGPVGDSIEFTLPAADVETVSLAFDNNMGIILNWKLSTGGANLYYFDTISGMYITRFFSNITSCRVSVDDARNFNTSQSDVLFLYTLNDNLYWRQQRDRYDIEYLVAPTTKKIRKAAMNVENRFQIQLI